MNYEFDVEINDLNRLKAFVGRVDRDIEQISLEVLSEVCDLIVGYAKIYVPVETGALRDSIRKERGGVGMGWAEFRVRAGGYIVNPRTGKLVDYAAAVEQHTPYMRPALEEVEPEIAMMIEGRMAEVAREV